MPRRDPGVPPPIRDRDTVASFETLHENLNLAAAGEADFPRLLVADAEIEEAWFAVGDGGERLLDDGTLDATAGDRPDELAVLLDREFGTHRARGGTPGGDDGRECHALAGVLPTRGLLKNAVGIVHAAAPLSRQ